jgi:hypothetical protein
MPRTHHGKALVPTRVLGATWADAWRDPALRVHLLVTPPALAVTLAALAAFLPRVEERPGATLADPILAALPARDCTWMAFGVIYLALGVGLCVLLGRPRALVVGVQSYVVMIAARIGVMSLTPLDPPPGMIPLRDPVIEHFARGQVFTRDLFFSGHTATLVLLLLAVPVGRLGKAVLLACAAGVAAAVLVQHVHYAIDVIAAPPFAFASYALVRKMHTWHHRRARRAATAQAPQAPQTPGPVGQRAGADGNPVGTPHRGLPDLSAPGGAR